MDAIITYSNGNDPKFQELYSKYKNDVATDSNRWRDLGTFKYVLRGIDKYMPFIENVFIIVKFETQIPEWLNKDNVHIVYEDEIVPKEFLPVFNSTAIELFLHKIPGISNEFIYFNDDMIPWNNMTKEDFIKDGKIFVKVHTWKYNRNDKDIHYNILHNGLELTKLLTNPDIILFPEHFPYAFLKNEVEECYKLYEKDILNSISRFREYKNLDHSLYLFHCLGKNKIINRINEIGLYTEIGYGNVTQSLATCNLKMVCVNDAGKKDDDKIKLINFLLNNRMPNKSKFEK